MLDPFETSSTLLRAAVRDVHRALDPLTPLPSERAAESDLATLSASPHLVTYAKTLHELSGLLKYAALALCDATDQAHVARGQRSAAVRAINAQASKAHEYAYRAHMVLWDVTAQAASLPSSAA